MTFALALSLIGIAFAIIAYPVFRARATGETRRDWETDELRERREAALTALRDVEFDYRVGKLSDADYESLRAQLKAQAAVAIKNYDQQVSALDAAVEEQARARDAVIEEQVRARRRPRPRPLSSEQEKGELVCANCGRAAQADDVFCARCGARLPEPKRDPVMALSSRTTFRASTPGRISRGWLIGAGLFAMIWIALAAFLYFEASAQARSQNPIATLSVSDFHSLAISPINPNLIFFGHHSGAMVSADGGSSWSPLNVTGDAMALAISRAAPERIYLAGQNVFMRSDDGGKTWRAVENDLPSQDIHALAALWNVADVLYAFVFGQGMFLSEDGGTHWQLIARGLPDDVSALAVLPGNPDIFYVGTQSNGVWRSPDGGATWQSANGIVGGALRGRSVRGLAFDFQTGALYAGTEDGLSYSPNTISGWIHRNLDSDVAALAVSDDGLTIVVVNSQGQVYRSTDRGVTWSGK